MVVALGILAILSLLLTLCQWDAGWRFPLHERVKDKSYTPPITLLKPLKGLDGNSLECLRSWIRQDYPGEVQVLFGVASPEDPVVKIVHQLIAEYPKTEIQLIICHEDLGVNAKVSSLLQMLRVAQHEIVIVSDADVLVPEDFLLNVVEPLRDQEIGLVNCFYRLDNPTTLAMRWEAFSMNSDFWSQVLQGQSLAPLDFALGAVMATRRQQLAKIGGFEAVADHLADDYQLGNRIVRIGGKKIALCPVVVDCLSHPMNWGETWSHQLRWARTIRVCKPIPYALSILGNATIWPLLWFILAPSQWSLGTLALCLLLRIVSAHSLQKRLGAIKGQGWFCLFAPAKDLLQTMLWAGAFYGDHIVWRGERFVLQRDGRLVRALDWD